MAELTHKRLQHSVTARPRMAAGGRLLLVLASMIVLGFVAGRWLMAPSSGMDALPGIHFYQPAPALSAFRLHDPAGRAVTPADLRGRWWFVFFGYTSCPDVCASSMIQLSEVDKAIGLTGATASPRRYLFVSVDPARDDGPQLAQYVRHFGSQFRAATGSAEQLAELERQLDAYHRLGASDSNGHYEVQHSSYAYLIDPQGRLSARLEPPFDPLMAASAFQRLQPPAAGGEG